MSGLSEICCEDRRSHSWVKATRRKSLCNLRKQTIAAPATTLVGHWGTGCWLSCMDGREPWCPQLSTRDVECPSSAGKQKHIGGYCRLQTWVTVSYWGLGIIDSHTGLR